MHTVPQVKTQLQAFVNYSKQKVKTTEKCQLLEAKSKTEKAALNAFGLWPQAVLVFDSTRPCLPPGLQVEKLEWWMGQTTP